MASHTDAHPDSAPQDPTDSPERISPDKDRDGVEDAPGDFAGTAGAGGENKVQDQSFER